ncbi:MAG TPA: hypothetical protein VI076_13870, partial [Actinopolymorphaceae bacterium]
LLVPMTRKRYEETRAFITQELQHQSVLYRAAEGIDWTPPELPAYSPGGTFSSHIRGLIHFKPDWKAEFIPLERPSILEDQLMGALDRSLWPVMLQLTEHEERTGKTHS